MLSRVADALYWLARYMERAENNVRLLGVQLTSELEEAGARGQNALSSWERLIEINGNLTLFSTLHMATQVDTSRSALDFLTMSEDNPNSIFNCVRYARENTRAIREIIPSELWEVINAYYHAVRDYDRQHWELQRILDFQSLVKSYSMQHHGVVAAIMPRGEALCFMKLGTYLERAQKMARILSMSFQENLQPHPHPEAFEYHYWSGVLQSVSAHESYLLKYKAFIKPRDVGEYLLFDADFPRSIRSCVDELMHAFQELEHGQVHPYSRELYVRIGRLQADLGYTDIQEILDRDVSEYLYHIQLCCNEIGNSIVRTYYLGEVDTVEVSDHADE